MIDPKARMSMESLRKLIHTRFIQAFQREPRDIEEVIAFSVALHLSSRRWDLLGYLAREVFPFIVNFKGEGKGKEITTKKGLQIFREALGLIEEIYLLNKLKDDVQKALQEAEKKGFEGPEN